MEDYLASESDLEESYHMFRPSADNDVLDDEIAGLIEGDLDWETDDWNWGDIWDSDEGPSSWVPRVESHRK